MTTLATTRRARWKELSPLLDELLDLGGEARARRLAELWRVDAEGAAELADLLAREGPVARGGFLEGLAPEPGPSGELVGRTVGAYTIERALGQGGMGTVWLARRSDGRFEGQAAVKFLALLGQGGAERFRREGSILARLSHPNIARLIDAGVSAGMPYLVLEYVEGEPFDAWCDARALGVMPRIELFLAVLAAVAHAHDRMVLHRDLKPSNLLVTSRGEPKLLDFGIAKLLEGEAASGQATELTSQAGRAFTPGYAAPEQVQGGDATPATDVYALGVNLYRLLAGVHPTARPGAPPVEQLRALVEAAPPRASQAAARAGPEVARQRGTTSAQLARALRGDLDNILARALEKEPGRRYPTAHALADDLRRHLAQEPVSARRGTLGYRLGKAARRHRLAFAGAGATALALVAGVVGTTWQAVEASRQRAEALREGARASRAAEQANAQRDLARRQLSRAEAVSDLNAFLLYEAAPNGRPFTAADLLARAERIVSRQEPAADANRVEMLVSLGRQYRRMENLARARPLLEKAHALSMGLEEPSTRAKAACGLAAVLARTGEGARADRLIEEALAALPDEPELVLDRIECLLLGSGVASDEGNHPSVAVERARAAGALLAQVGFPVDFLGARVEMTLAEAFRTAGRLPEAAEAFERAFGLLARLGRDDTESAGTVLNNWGVALDQLGRPLEAEALFRRAIRIGSADGGEGGVAPQLLKNLAFTLETLDRLPEAARLTEHAHARARRERDESVVNQALLLRAQVYRRQGDLRRAGGMIAECEPRFRRMLPPGSAYFAALESQRSQLLQAQGDPEGAGAAADRAVAIAEAGGQPGILSEMLARRAEVRLRASRWEEARRDAERALGEARRAVGDGPGPSRARGAAHLALGRAQRGLGDAASARISFEAASGDLAPTLGPGHPLARAARRLAAEAAPEAGAR